MRTPNSTLRHWMLVPATAAVAAGIALVAAPSAGADNDPSCRASGVGTVCQKQGHASLHARPAMPRGQSSLMDPSYMPGYGRGPMIPMWAYD